MNRIEKKFQELKKINKKALITFITAGDPTLETTKALVVEMQTKGADIVELGIPYSDPIAEGPVIQRANERALKNPLKIKDILNAVKELREVVSVPLVFLLYYNCILQYGMERFLEDCTEAGVDGLIIPDLPSEEREEIEEIAQSYPVDLITLVAPTSKDRIEKAVKKAKGFVYCVSSLGVTGVRNSFDTDFEEFFSTINKHTSTPKALGFGISTPEHVRQLKGFCDGLIVGSAIVKLVEKSKDLEDAVSSVGDYVKSLREALDE